MKENFNECFIKTNRLTIKPYETKDLDDLALILFNEEIAKTFMVPEFKNIDEAKNLASKLIKNENKNLQAGIYLKNKLIGFINDVGYDNEGIELGYVIDPNYKGNGYATEALKGMIEYLFSVGFIKICSAYFENNIASKRVMEKSGMVDMNLKETVLYREKKHICIYMGIMKKIIEL